jgi:hypothetical protein
MKSAAPMAMAFAPRPRGRVAADHEDRQVGLLVLDLLQELDAVDPGEAHVEEEHVDPPLGQAGDELLGGLEGLHLVALALQHHREGPADVALVVDDDDALANAVGAFCHRLVAIPPGPGHQPV